MRKVLLFGAVLALASGCGRGWLPMFRGAPCNSGPYCAPAVPASYGSNCTTGCGSAAGYGEYQGEISAGDSYSSDAYSGNGYYNGGTVVDDYPIEGALVNPPMAPVTQPAN